MRTKLSSFDYAEAVMNPDAWRQHFTRTGESLHVCIDGEDVTRRCYRAAFHEDRINGDVFLFRKNAEGLCFLKEGAIAREIRTGVLTIEPGAAFS